MDIPVSHLNRRMALQVPPELPLGLVFIVGHVHDLQTTETEDRLAHLQLRDDEHALDCRLMKQIVEETLLREGDRVRVGGQLTFNVLSARYQLLAHHLEVLAPATEKRRAGPSMISGRRGDGKESALASPELPGWVRKLAPPEIRQELGFSVDVDDKDVESAALGRHEMGAATPAAKASSFKAPGADFIADLPPEMVRFLSQAIDSDEDVELTPDMLAAFAHGDKPAPVTAADRETDERRARSSGDVGSVNERERPREHAREGDDLVDLFVAWLANPQLYLIPLLMFLVFLVAIFVFFLFQQ